MLLTFVLVCMGFMLVRFHFYFVRLNTRFENLVVILVLAEQSRIRLQDFF